MDTNLTNLTTGSVTKSILLFAAPMIAGNLFQQFYNIADTLIVGHYLGSDALAAVGASFTLMTFLTSIFIGLCMGCAIYFSMKYGAKDEETLKSGIALSFLLILLISLIINAIVLYNINPILKMLNIPNEILDITKAYLEVIFYGLLFTFLYNYFASLLKAIGNSVTPLVFLIISAIINIALDLYFILIVHTGVEGAAYATVISQAVSAFLVTAYCLIKLPLTHLKPRHFRIRKNIIRQLLSYSILTCIQQSVMNLGILMVQGLVNSFGVSVMAAFAAAVKIDSFAYMPVQDFGNAFSTFIAQNLGAGNTERIKSGIRSAALTATSFCIVISAVVLIFAEKLMMLFVNSSETGIISIGAEYLRIEGAFYCAIGVLFLLYGLYRGLGKPGMSIVLTVISLGTRVGLAYLLAPIQSVGVLGIWSAIPIGWILADIAGIIYYRRLS